MHEFSLVVRKNGKTVFRSLEKGLKPLALVFFNNRKLLEGADVFDKVVGEAAARLFILSKVKSVEAGVASEKALALLEKAEVSCRARLVAGTICGEDGKGQCKMEKLSGENPSDEAFLKELSRIFLKRG